MVDDLELRQIAILIADPARTRILRMLIDGSARPAGELAYTASISAQSANGHLAKLVEGGLLSVEVQERHRYFRITSPELTRSIKGVASLTTATKPRSPRAPLPTVDTPLAFLQARTCYGHLAGAMAVSILEAMLTHGWLIADGRKFSLTTAGEKRLTVLGVNAHHFPQSRRVLARPCNDLTQRRAHLSGALGNALLDAFVANRWIIRNSRSRAVKITRDGHQGMRKLFRLSANS